MRHRSWKKYPFLSRMKSGAYDGMDILNASLIIEDQDDTIETLRAELEQAEARVVSLEYQLTEPQTARECELQNRVIVLESAMRKAESKLARAELVEWRPIETAPKDGRLLLVVHDGTMITSGNRPFPPTVKVGFYVSNKNGADYVAVVDPGQYYYGCIFDDRAGEITHGRVTHWKPLPEPPKALNTQEDG